MRKRGQGEHRFGASGRLSPRVLGLEPVEQGVLVESGGGGAVAVVALDVGDGVRVLHHLDQARLVPRGEAAVRDHPAITHTTVKRRQLPSQGLEH